MPECALPDWLYTTHERTVSFCSPSFSPFRIEVSLDGQWLRRVLDIIQSFPEPRLRVTRPLRLAGGEPETLGQPAAPSEAVERRGFERMLAARHTQVYENLMAQCAARYVRPDVLVCGG